MKKLSITTLLFIFIYSIINNDLGLYRSLIDSTFIIGLIYLSIGLIFYVRNVGFFKTLAYYSYKKKELRHLRQDRKKDFKNRLNDDMEDEKNIMEFHEFCEENYSNVWDNKIYFLFALPLLLLSFIGAFLKMK